MTSASHPCSASASATLTTSEIRSTIYNPEHMKRRGISPELLELYLSVPDEALNKLVTYVKANGLRFSRDTQEAMLLPRKAKLGVHWDVVCHPIGYGRIARATGLFRPGSESLSYVDDGMVVTAHGYYRDSINDPWIFTCSGIAHFHTYAELESPDEGKTWIPSGEWKAMPEIRLAEIARILCIQQAIPDYMADHRVSGMALESLRRLRTTVF